MNPPTKPLSNVTKTETLTYLGRATIAKHGAKGVRYRHTDQRDSGGESKVLVFESHRQAAKWINPLGTP